jgi:hypothetical protein
MHQHNQRMTLLMDTSSGGWKVESKLFYQLQLVMMDVVKPLGRT